MEKPVCPSCHTPIDVDSAPGRPKVYCGEPCRRMAEFAIRGLVRRLDKYEVELRETKAENTDFQDWERSRRMRQLRTWIKTDRAKLRALLGVRIQIDADKRPVTSPENVAI